MGLFMGLFKPEETNFVLRRSGSDESPTKGTPRT